MASESKKVVRANKRNAGKPARETKVNRKSGKTNNARRRTAVDVVLNATTQRPSSSRGGIIRTGTQTYTTITPTAKEQVFASLPRRVQVPTDFLVQFTASLKQATADWTVECRRLVVSYAQSLTAGDGTKPKELASNAAETVNKLFVATCQQHPTVSGLPGQSLPWYSKIAEANSNAHNRVLAASSV